MSTKLLSRTVSSFGKSGPSRQITSCKEPGSNFHKGSAAHGGSSGGLGGAARESSFAAPHRALDLSSAAPPLGFRLLRRLDRFHHNPPRFLRIAPLADAHPLLGFEIFIMFEEVLDLLEHDR